MLVCWYSFIWVECYFRNSLTTTSEINQGFRFLQKKWILSLILTSKLMKTNPDHGVYFNENKSFSHAISCVRPKKQNFPTLTSFPLPQRRPAAAAFGPNRNKEATKKEGTVFAFGVCTEFLVSSIYSSLVHAWFLLHTFFFIHRVGFSFMYSCMLHMEK